MSDEELDRAAFERWVMAQPLFGNKDDARLSFVFERVTAAPGHYYNQRIDDSWQGWRAAMIAAREGK